MKSDGWRKFGAHRVCSRTTGILCLRCTQGRTGWSGNSGGCPKRKSSGEHGDICISEYFCPLNKFSTICGPVWSNCARAENQPVRPCLYEEISVGYLGSICALFLWVISLWKGIVLEVILEVKNEVWDLIDTFMILSFESFPTWYLYNFENIMRILLINARVVTKNIHNFWKF